MGESAFAKSDLECLIEKTIFRCLTCIMLVVLNQIFQYGYIV
jgi:hypothetical protein